MPRRARTLGMDPEALPGRKIQNLLSATGQAGFAEYRKRIETDGVAEGTMVRASRRTERSARGSTVNGAAPDRLRSGRAWPGLRPSPIAKRSSATLARPAEAHFRSIIENVLRRHHDHRAGGGANQLCHSLHSKRSSGTRRPSCTAARSSTSFIRTTCRHADGVLRTPFRPAPIRPTPSNCASVIPMDRRASSRWWPGSSWRGKKQGPPARSLRRADITERRKLQGPQLQTANRLASLGRPGRHRGPRIQQRADEHAAVRRAAASVPSPKPDLVLKSAWHIAHSIGRGKPHRPGHPPLHAAGHRRPSCRSGSISGGAFSIPRSRRWWPTTSRSSPTSAILSLHILADASQLAQVFVNLLTNARDAMPDGWKNHDLRATSGVWSNVPVRRRRRSAAVHPPLRLRHRDAGFLPKWLQHIFEPLFTTKRTGTGTGPGGHAPRPWSGTTVSDLRGEASKSGGRRSTSFSLPAEPVAPGWRAVSDRASHPVAPAADGRGRTGHRRRARRAAARWRISKSPSVASGEEAVAAGRRHSIPTWSCSTSGFPASMASRPAGGSAIEDRRWR